MPLKNRQIVLVTGPSGAGLSTATAALEDAGFEAIDNLPLRMIPPLLNLRGQDRPLSLGIDLRNRDFSAQAVLDLASDLVTTEGYSVQLLYLDCNVDEILRRYSSTKRRHPVTDAPTLADSIVQEMDILQPVRARADVLIDTSDLNPHQLRAEVERWFSPDGTHRTSVQVQSFSYKRGLPRSVDMVFDCRFLRNPHWTPDLRDLDGEDEAVRAFVSQDPRFEAFLEKVLDLCEFLLPAAEEEGKSYLTFAFGCTGGRHRSVTLAEMVADALAKKGWPVSTRHRELDRSKRQEART